jgi:hypothetical protein
VLRTRLQTEALRGETIRYRSFFGDIIRQEGVRALYKGLPVTLVKNMQMGLQLPLYTYLKKDNNINPMIAGAISKIVASSVVYPLDSIRTNVRATKGDISYKDVVVQIMKRPGGALNFFRGLPIYWCTQVPIFAITMGAFESLTNKS